MRFTLKKSLVTLSPESPEERVMLEAVWRSLIDCTNSTRRLTPIGEFVPARNQSAMFTIEGDDAESLPVFPTITVDFACRVYCDICNRIQDLQPGQSIPPCCDKLMEFID